MIKNKLIILLFIFITNFTSAQQSSAEVTKKDGRYITHLDASEQDINYYKDKSGLVKSIKLGIEWWSSIGEPIEKYLIKWERGSSVKSFKHNRSISQNDLSKYPDLLKRYNNLKPTKIDLEFTVVFNFEDQENFVNNIPKCMRNSHSTGVSYDFINGVRTLSSKTNYLIEAAGVNGNDLVPGSPKTWLDFISYECNSDNKITKSIFINSTNAKFMLLEVLKIEVPTIEIDAIVGEYLEREKEESPKKENDWGDLDDEKSTASKNNWDLDTEKNTNDSWISDNNKSSNGWGETKNGDDGANKYSIKSKDGKQAVVNESGGILIPYGKWQIIEYKPTENMALVKVQITKSDNICGNGYNTTYYKEGYIDSNGEYVIPPKEKHQCLKIVELTQPALIKIETIKSR